MCCVCDLLRAKQAAYCPSLSTVNGRTLTLFFIVFFTTRFGGICMEAGRITRKPHPLLSPVFRSHTILTSTTSPKLEKKFSSSSSEVCEGKENELNEQ